MKKKITQRELLKLIRDECAKTSQRDFAARIGVKPQYISDVVNGKREVGPKILAGLRLKRVVMYERIEQG